ncbi:glycerophosphodiester phosphodiesterase [Rhodothermaceae bacterium RA]|nr:glycerophosphodiester phosphodiesterase [Rhodothermaceae bacterium RA]
MRSITARRAGLVVLLLTACTASTIHPDAAMPFDLQGHRGARGLLPENTMPAFRRALELGVTTLEMDVVISKDGQVVVSHEPWFSGTICTQPDGTPVPVEDERRFNLYALPYAEIARYDCGSRRHPRFPRQQPVPAVKPLLKDVIAMAEAYVAETGRPPVHYNIETKSTPEGDGLYHPEPERFTRLLYDVLVETGIKDRSIIQSFDVRTLQVVRRLDPALRLALLVGREADAGVDGNLERLGFTPALYSPDYRLVDAALVEAVHARGMQLIPWTVNDLDEMRRLKALGVDGLITDYPDVGVQLLAE